MMEPVHALKRAIRRTLADDAQLSALAGRIHDEPPATARFPYLTFGAASCDDWSTDDCDGCEVMITLHGWSRASGSGEVLQMAGRMRSLLHEAELPLPGCRLVSLRLVESETAYRPTGRVHHAALHLRALIELA